MMLNPAFSYGKPINNEVFPISPANEKFQQAKTLRGQERVKTNEEEDPNKIQMIRLLETTESISDRLQGVENKLQQMPNNYKWPFVGDFNRRNQWRPNKFRGDQNGQPKRENREEKRSFTCFNCGQGGHKAYVCPNKKGEGKKKQQDETKKWGKSKEENKKPTATYYKRPIYSNKTLYRNDNKIRSIKEEGEKSE
jgi:hypothetical protein